MGWKADGILVSKSENGEMTAVVRTKEKCIDLNRYEELTENMEFNDTDLIDDIGAWFNDISGKGYKNIEKKINERYPKMKSILESCDYVEYDRYYRLKKNDGEWIIVEKLDLSDEEWNEKMKE